jgi:hypothetical protein
MSTKFLIEPSYDNHSTQCCSYLFYRTSHGSCSGRMVLFANAILYLNECNILPGTGWWCLVGLGGVGHCFTWQDTHPFRVLVLVCWNIDGVMTTIMEQIGTKCMYHWRTDLWVIKAWVGNKWEWYFFSGWCRPGIVCTKMVLYISGGDHQIPLRKTL